MPPLPIPLIVAAVAELLSRIRDSHKDPDKDKFVAAHHLEPHKYEFDPPVAISHQNHYGGTSALGLDVSSPENVVRLVVRPLAFARHPALRVREGSCS